MAMKSEERGAVMSLILQRVGSIESYQIKVIILPMELP